MSKSLRKQKRDEYINLYKKWNIIINDESSLYDIPLIKERADGRDCEYILNMLKREIGYFVATLSEKEIFELFDELKKTTEDTVIIEEIINKFPKKYMLNENT